jgi:hypothetical protein
LTVTDASEPGLTASGETATETLIGASEGAEPLSPAAAETIVKIRNAAKTASFLIRPF